MVLPLPLSELDVMILPNSCSWLLGVEAPVLDMGDNCISFCCFNCNCDKASNAVFMAVVSVRTANARATRSVNIF